jgi:diguanylate cyclase (GGDEF)-like protein
LQIRNWTVGKKLGAAFAAVLMLLAAVALFSLWQIGQLQQSSEFLRNDGLHKSTLAQTAQRAARSQVTALYSLFLLDQREARIPIYPIIDKNRDLLSTTLEELRKIETSESEMAVFARVLAARESFDKSVYAIVDEIELDPGSAKAVMVRQTGPELDQLVRRLDELVVLQDGRVEAEIASNREAEHLARMLIVLLGAAATAIAALSAVAIARSIVRPLSGAVQFADEIAQGRLQAPLPRAGSGELATLLGALARMRDGIEARERRIGMLAYSDVLTGLPNRTRFHQQLGEMLMEENTRRQGVGVLLMNLNRFTNVNDALGYEAGDTLLKEAGVRIRSILERHGGMVARLQGDEFSALLPSACADQAAADIVTAMSRPVDIAGQPVDVEISIGIALAPQHGLEPDRLLLCANQAMLAAKRANSGPITYDPQYAPDVGHNLSLFSELRRAVEQDELALYFQPQLCLQTNTVPRAEVLVRWHHPQRGVVPPDSFIPFAEQTGAIRKITRWVLEHACAQLAAWQHSGLNLGLCVNLSARDLTDASFPEFIDALLRRHGLARKLLSLAVTESAAMEDPQQGLQALERLRNLELRLSIDDFGTGYSSLAYLKRLPVDEIKIDKSFVLDMDNDADDDKIVRSTVDLGRIMDLEVIAEGVETETALNRLREYGCHFAQGYFIARPMPKDKFEQWLSAQREAVQAIALNT